MENVSLILINQGFISTIFKVTKPDFYKTMKHNYKVVESNSYKLDKTSFYRITFSHGKG